MPRKHDLSLQGALGRIAEWLERKELTRHEVRLRLENIGYADPVIDEAIERAGAYAWLDDERAAGRIAEIGRSTRLEGKAKIRQRMEMRGIAEPVAEQVLEPITSESEYEIALAAIQKRNLDRTEYAKAARFLMARGFDEEVVEQVLESEFDLPDSL